MRYIAIILGALALIWTVGAPSAVARPCDACDTTPNEPGGGGGGGGGGSTSTGTTTLTATFSYADRDPASGATKPSPIAHARVEVWRYAPRDFGIWSWAAERNVTTDGAGRMSTQFPFVGAGVTYGLRVFAENYATVVYPNDAAHTVPFHREPGEPGPVVNKQASGPGQTLDFSFHFADQWAAQHYNIADTIRFGNDYARARRDPSEVDPLPRADVQPTSATANGGSWYNPAKDTIVIHSDDVDEDLLILHEYAHFLQEQLSSFAWIATSHNGCNVEDAKHAWLEGFADYFAQVIETIEPAGTFEATAGAGTPTRGALEGPSCGGSATGDQLELFVGATLWDLFDRPADFATPSNESSDALERLDTQIFQIFDRELDTGAYPTLTDFRRAWLARGLDIAGLDRILAAHRVPVPGFERLDGVLTSAPAAASSQGGRLDVFVRGTDESLYHKTYEGGWGAWVPVAGDLLDSAPAAASSGPGNLDVFYRRKDGTLGYRAYRNGSWSAPQSLGGQLTSGPAVAAPGGGLLHVFVRGTDNGLHHIWFDGSQWSAWEALGGKLIGDPAAVSWGPGRVDVFLRGTDDQLYQRFYQNGWSGWIPHGGVLTSSPAVASWTQGRLDVFVRGVGGGMYQKFWDSGWSGWIPHGGALATDPEAVSWGPGRIDVFTGGADGALWTKWYDGTWRP